MNFLASMPEMAEASYKVMLHPVIASADVTCITMNTIVHPLLIGLTTSRAAIDNMYSRKGHYWDEFRGKKHIKYVL